MCCWKYTISTVGAIHVESWCHAGADPGEVKWVNFHPPFSEPLLSFFSYPSNIDLKHLNKAWVILHYYKNSPPISKSWIRACHEELRHVGLTPIALCELMSREQVRPKLILPWMKMILPWWNLICRGWKWFCRDETDFAVLWIWFYRDEIDFAVAKLILPWWNWFCRGEVDFAVMKLILLWRNWFCRE